MKPRGSFALRVTQQMHGEIGALRGRFVDHPGDGGELRLTARPSEYLFRLACTAWTACEMTFKGDLEQVL